MAAIVKDRHRKAVVFGRHATACLCVFCCLFAVLSLKFNMKTCKRPPIYNQCAYVYCCGRKVYIPVLNKYSVK